MHAQPLNISQELVPKEKRVVNRISIDALVSCRYYSSTKKRSSNAMMLNFSESGSYIRENS